MRCHRELAGHVGAGRSSGLSSRPAAFGCLAAQWHHHMRVDQYAAIPGTAQAFEVVQKEGLRA